MENCFSDDSLLEIKEKYSEEINNLCPYYYIFQSISGIVGVLLNYDESKQGIIKEWISKINLYKGEISEHYEILDNNIDEFLKIVNQNSVLKFSLVKNKAKKCIDNFNDLLLEKIPDYSNLCCRQNEPKFRSRILRIFGGDDCEYGDRCICDVEPLGRQLFF